MNDNKIYNLALTIAHGIGPVHSAKIMNEVDSAQEFFEMDEKDRKNHFDDLPKNVLAIDSEEAINKAEDEIRWCKKNNTEIISFLHDDYPRRLRHIPDKPLSLYKRGNCDLDGVRTVAIVGTRKCTEYGKIFVDNLVRDLKPYGVQIISGMAYGIDGSAHRAALKYDIPTIGVLGHGINMIYPPKHRSMAKKILENGALITEFSHEKEPEREHFPMRNRIIAGMSDVVIIIQSGATGGSMITADLANNYNKDVFALPGRYNDERSRGCNLLIKSQRAHLMESVEDIQYIMRWKKQEDQVNSQPSLFYDLNEEQKELIHLLKHHKKLHIDQLSGELGKTTSKVSEILLTLELQGLVRSLPGNRYIAT